MSNSTTTQNTQNRMIDGFNVNTEKSEQTLVYGLHNPDFIHKLSVAGIAKSIFDYPFLIGDEEEVIVNLVYTENGTVVVAQTFTSEDIGVCKYYLKEFINMLIAEGEIDSDGNFLGGSLTAMFSERLEA